jgi:hypothetical protein
MCVRVWIWKQKLWENQKDMYLRVLTGVCGLVQ